MPNQYSVPGQLTNFEMGTPRVTPDGVVSWGGVDALQPAKTYPQVPGVVYDLFGNRLLEVATTGKFPAVRGTLDAWLTTGAAGTARNILTLINTAGPRIVRLSLDTSNRPVVVVTDDTPVNVAVFAPSGGAIGTGIRLHLRMIWDAQKPIAAGDRHVAVFQNDEPVAGAWSTEPQTSWVPFLAPALRIGLADPSVSDFNGTFEVIQVGNESIS